MINQHCLKKKGLAPGHFFEKWLQKPILPGCNTRCLWVRGLFLYLNSGRWTSDPHDKRRPINMPLCASTGPVLGRCCQHRTRYWNLMSCLQGSLLYWDHSNTLTTCTQNNLIVNCQGPLPLRAMETKAMALAAKVIRLWLLSQSRPLLSSKCHGFGVLAVSESGPCWIYTA